MLAQSVWRIKTGVKSALYQLVLYLSEMTFVRNFCHLLLLLFNLALFHNTARLFLLLLLYRILFGAMIIVLLQVEEMLLMVSWWIAA